MQQVPGVAELVGDESVEPECSLSPKVSCQTKQRTTLALQWNNLHPLLALGIGVDQAHLRSHNRYSLAKVTIYCEHIVVHSQYDWEGNSPRKRPHRNRFFHVCKVPDEVSRCGHAHKADIWVHAWQTALLLQTHQDKSGGVHAHSPQASSAGQYPCCPCKYSRGHGLRPGLVLVAS